jgi:hypothetical protein
MIYNKSERILLVAPNIFSVQVLESNKQIKHITSIDRVFPTIYEMVPSIIIFDYDYLSDDLEKILRRIRTNSYYNKIKICCFKSSPNGNIDSFLKILGVNQVIYKSELDNNHPPAKSILDQAKSMFNTNVIDLLSGSSSSSS